MAPSQQECSTSVETSNTARAILTPPLNDKGTVSGSTPAVIPTPATSVNITGPAPDMTDGNATESANSADVGMTDDSAPAVSSSSADVGSVSADRSSRICSYKV